MTRRWLAPVLIAAMTLTLAGPAPAAERPDFQPVALKVIMGVVYVMVQNNNPKATYDGQIEMKFRINDGSPFVKKCVLFFSDNEAFDVKCFSLASQKAKVGDKVYAEVNAYRRVRETNMANNAYLGAIGGTGMPVVPPEVDLTLEHLRHFGPKDEIRYSVANNGPLPFKGKVRIGVTVNEVKKDDIYRTFNLRAREAKDLTFPYPLKPGRNVIHLAVDKNNEIRETNEKNNWIQKTFYPKKNVLELLKRIALGRPGTRTRKIVMPGTKKIIITPSMMAPRRGKTNAAIMVDTSVRGTGRNPGGDYYIGVNCILDGKLRTSNTIKHRPAPAFGKIAHNSDKHWLPARSGRMAKLQIRLYQGRELRGALEYDIEFKGKF